jgi:hypothetical protein
MGDLTPNIIQVLFGLFGVIVGSLISAGVQILTVGKRIDADVRIAQRRFEFDMKLSEQRFFHDRQQSIFKRRFELAEHMLSDAYRFRDLMTFVRSPVSREGEGVNRPILGEESDDVRRRRTIYFVPVERLQKSQEFISAMMARQPACRAHFGEDVTKAFDAFTVAIARVRTSSSMLISMVGDDERPQGSHVLRERLESDIWQGYREFSEQDRISGEIDKAVFLIEGVCRPVLERVDDLSKQ